MSLASPDLLSVAPTAAPLPPAPTQLDEAILRALLYADIFDYALTPAELHRYLTEAGVTPEAISQAFDTSPWLAGQVSCGPHGLVTLRGRTHLAAVRLERQRSSARLWPAARRWAAFTSGLPFVRMVAVTGALAVDNALPNDDIDFLVVTEPGRVWLTRALIVGVVRLARLAGVGLCPNYVLARSALAQTQQDLYTAHELLQMVPLAGHEVYLQMCDLNPWAAGRLPHAARPRGVEPDLRPHGLRRLLQQAAERLLSGRLGDALEAWERGRKLRKFRAAAARPGSAARLDSEHAKGHFDDHGSLIRQRYLARLARHGLEPEAAEREAGGPARA